MLHDLLSETEGAPGQNLDHSLKTHWSLIWRKGMESNHQIELRGEGKVPDLLVQH